jgi:hypothetical protein
MDDIFRPRDSLLIEAHMIDAYVDELQEIVDAVYQDYQDGCVLPRRTWAAIRTYQPQEDSYADDQSGD